MRAPPEKANGACQGAAANQNQSLLCNDTDTRGSIGAQESDNSIPDFDWSSDDSIALCDQPSVAVYANRYGQIVLRRERAWNEEEDPCIPIAQENVLAIIGAILRAAGMEDVRLYRETFQFAYGAGCEDIELPEPNSENSQNVVNSRNLPTRSSGAERSRRYRQNKKKRDAGVTERDAERDGVTPMQLVAAE
jgi:hypothetical protein